MIRLCFPVRPLYANCYIIADEDSSAAAIIDPGGEGPRILAEVETRGLTVTHILHTHGHLDHTSADAYLQEATGAPLCIHPADADLIRNPSPEWMAFMELPPPVEPDILYEEGDTVELGGLVLRVLHTPGHTPGSVCLCCDEYVFAGDTIFAGSVGRTDLGGSIAQLAASLREKIATLPDEPILLPGHEQQTTVRAEKARNPFLQAAMRGEPLW